MSPLVHLSNESHDTGPEEGLLESALRNIELNPSAPFYARMKQAPWAARPAAFPTKARPRLPRPALALSLVTALVVVGFVLATPQGRAWAQTVLQFFARSESDSRQISSEEATAPLAFQDDCGSMAYPRCSVAQVRAMAGFPIRELGSAPEGMSFVGASGAPERVMLLYRGERGSITLAQSPSASDAPDEWPVGAGADVEPVTVHGSAGEYVQGTWGGAGLPEDALVTWDESPATQTLRWQEGGIRYTISFSASKTGSGPIFGRDDLVGFAESLTSESVAVVPAVPHATSIEEIAAQAGFPVTEPAWLPAGYAFDHATYSSEHQAACLCYRYLDLEGWPLLTVAEIGTGVLPAIGDLQTVVLFNGQPVEAAVDQQMVSVGGAAGGQGQLAITGVDTSRLCGGEAQHANMTLLWQAVDRSFAVFASIDQYDGRGFLTRLEMSRLAESLTGVSTIPPDALDPGRLPTIEAAERLAGFDLLAPTRVPEGFAFAYAAYREIGDPEVTLLYFSSTRDSIGRSHGYVLTQTTGSPNTLEEVAMGGGYEWTTVHGEPAVYRQMCWDATAEGFDAACYLELSWYEEGLRFDVFANLPGPEVSRQALLAMADGIR